jgi:hypothetical protein
MSTIVEILREAEVTLPVSLVQALEKALRRERQERQLREEGLRAAMQAAARQADSRRGAVHQGSMRQQPAYQQPPVRQDSEPRVADSGRVVVGGDLISNNSPGRPDVTMVGRVSRPAKPIQSVKSKIVPEPDQIQSAPPRRSSPLEPPGF